MTILSTDKQTCDDLNIFSHREEDPSIFKYFLQTLTHGGKLRLNNIMQKPLSDAHKIKQRSAAISYIQDKAIEIDLQKEEIEFIEHYLNQNILILRSNPFDSVWNWLRNKYRPSNEYYIISRGLEYLRRLIQQLLEAIEGISKEDHPEFFNTLNTSIDHIDSIPLFKEFIHTRSKKIPFWKLGRYDYLMRVKEKETLKAFIRFTYDYDALRSVARVSEEKGLSFPVVDTSSSSSVIIKDMFHPFLAEPVKNDFMLGEKKLCFLSGANMSGKSTYLKSVGICMYLAHLGFPVPAGEMKFTVFNGLFSTINISDNITKGLSHYYSEVKRVKEIALKISERQKVFVIFDELFRGTNVKDAHDATLLLCKRFAKIKCSLFLISTHITEVAPFLGKEEPITLKCFHSRLEGDTPVYDYRLKDGVSSDRLGLTILKNEKVIEIIDKLIKAKK